MEPRDDDRAPPLEGILPALTTPFEDGRAAPERLAENVARYEAHGLSGYVVLGSTGEAALLDRDEKHALLRAARRAVPGARALVAGVGLESTEATIRLARDAADLGADYALVLTPHYYREAMTADALTRHYAAVADASPIPVVLYSVPKFTELPLDPRVAVALSRHENVAGIKDSSGDMGALRRMIEGCAPGFRVLCGHAGACREALAAGAAGAVLAAACALPEPFVALARLVAEARAAEADALAGRLGPAARLVASEHGLAGLKAAMDVRGLHGGAPRPPLRPLEPDARRTLHRGLEALVEQRLIPRLPL